MWAHKTIISVCVLVDIKGDQIDAVDVKVACWGGEYELQIAHRMTFTVKTLLCLDFCTLLPEHCDLHPHVT